MLHICMISGQQLPNISSEGVLAVSDLKFELRAVHGFPFCMQQLLHRSQILEDSTKLDACMDLQLVLRPLPAYQYLKASYEFDDACKSGLMKVARFLLQAGMDKNNTWQRDRTGLMQAARGNHVEIVQMLLQARASKDLRDAQGITALMHAAGDGRVEVARTLLEAGAERNLQDGNGNTALMRAAHFGHVETVRAFLEAGAD